MNDANSEPGQHGAARAFADVERDPGSRRRAAAFDIHGRAEEPDRTLAARAGFRPALAAMKAIPATAHASAVYKGQGVDVDVVKKPDEDSSHIAIAIHDADNRARTHTVDYVTDDASLDAALSTAVEIAHSVIDSEEGGGQSGPSQLSTSRRRVRIASQTLAAPGGF